MLARQMGQLVFATSRRPTQGFAGQAKQQRFSLRQRAFKDFDRNDRQISELWRMGLVAGRGVMGAKRPLVLRIVRP